MTISPAPDWIDHESGPRPVPADTKVYVRFESGLSDIDDGYPETAEYWATEGDRCSSWELRNEQDGITGYLVAAS